MAETLGLVVAVLTAASLAAALWPAGVWPRQEEELPGPKARVVSDILTGGVETMWSVSHRKERLKPPAKAAACSEEVDEWMQSDAVRGVPVGDHIRVVLTSERPESVVLTGISMDVRKVDVPSRTVATTCQAGNGFIVRGAKTVVDKVPLAFQFYDEDARKIDSLRVNLGKGDAAEITLLVTVGTPGAVYEWSGEFEALIGGRETTIPFTDDDEPFRVAGPPTREAESWLHPDYR
ncbi:hypothetical protein AB0I16_16880 [Streptomyces sp. NPDC050703]|uniref:hypothetical protein n=1 Tax=Streptomyces sp. NPDC050703 TaxID=3157218 RepID=UPI0034432CE3